MTANLHGQQRLEWAQAEADFGLSHLLLGSESAGLDWALRQRIERLQR
jgi:hypothetical protein